VICAVTGRVLADAGVHWDARWERAREAAEWIRANRPIVLRCFPSGLDLMTTAATVSEGRLRSGESKLARRYEK
jgi:hypothetical protein